MSCHVQKVCISVPGVRPLAEEELERRARAVELLRSGTSKLALHCNESHSLSPLHDCLHGMLVGAHSVAAEEL